MKPSGAPTGEEIVILAVLLSGPDEDLAQALSNPHVGTYMYRVATKSCYPNNCL